MQAKVPVIARSGTCVLVAVSRSTALDALRGTAALGVFVFHAWLYTLPVPAARGRTSAADFALHELRLGLVLFFVLSGFLLYGPWARAALAGGRAPRLSDYLRRRAARIVPAYYAALLGAIVLLWPLAGETGVRLPPAGDLWLFAVFAQNLRDSTLMSLDPPMWTLAVEASFYLVLPVIGWAALRSGRSRGRQVAVLLGLVGIGVAFNAWLASAWPGMPYAKSLPAMLPYFACGMLAAVLAQGWRPAGGRWLALAGLGLVVANAVWHARFDASGQPATDLMITVRDLPAAAGFGLILLAVGSGAPARPRPPVRALAGLGLVSYGFYLWHVPVLVALRAHGLLPMNPLGAVAVGGAVSIAVAAVSWNLLERPAIEWARRAGRERGRRRDPVPSTGSRAW